jgi:DNA-binding HxlR family transcriptional regulator
MKKTVKTEKKDQRKCHDLNRCPMHRLLTLLSGPWTTYILWLIRSKGSQRFGELKKAMPLISSKMLTERLRMLEEEGIVNRHQEGTIPPKVTYSATRRGKQLDKLLNEINSLAKKWYDAKNINKW